MLLEIKRGMQKEQTQVETAKEEEDKPVRKGNVFETF